MQNISLYATIDIIFWEFLMFYQIFISLQVKRRLIISNKLVYTSCLTSCRTTQDLRPQKIRKVQNNVKTLWKYKPVLSLPLKNKILSIRAKDSLTIDFQLFLQQAISHAEQSFTQIFRPYFSRETAFPSNSSQDPSNLICLTILATLRLLTQF